jgi:hypothetical protein
MLDFERLNIVNALLQLLRRDSHWVRAVCRGVFVFAKPSSDGPSMTCTPVCPSSSLMMHIASIDRYFTAGQHPRTARRGAINFASSIVLQGWRGCAEPPSELLGGTLAGRDRG